MLDLRHADLPAGEWYAPTLRHRKQDIKKLKGLGEPFIWFPWLGAFDEKLLRQEVETAMRLLTPKPSKASIDEAIRLRTPDCILKTGDTIKVYKVEGMLGSDDLEHPHDVQERKAYLSVEHAGEKSTHVPGYMVFYGISSVRGNGASSEVFASIEQRMLKFFGVQSLNETPEAAEQSGFAYDAFLKARWIKDSTSDMHELLDEHPLKSERHQAAFKLWDLVNASVHLGYNWAKGEADVEMKPLARKGKNITKGAAEGGRKGAKTRKQTQQEWQSLAQSFAIETRKINPTLTRNALTDKIIQKLADEKGITKGNRIIFDFLRELENSGQLSLKQ